MLPDRYKGGIVSFRNDRMGARILTLLNTIRIAHDYDLPYFFTWVSHGRASEELKSPTEIFDKAYFDAHFVSHEDFKLVNAAAQDIQTLSLTATAETISQHAAAGKAFVCAAPDLSCLPWEDETQVAEKYARAIAELKFNSKVIEAMDALKETLSGSGTAFHIRRGDIIYDPITSNNLWSNKYIPREYYEVLAQRLVKDPNARILVFSDEPKEIARLKAMSDQIITPSEVIQDDLTLAQRDFIEIFAMSLCNEIIGPPGSGFSASAALIGNKPIRDIRDVLSPEENGKAMDLLVARLEEHSDIFLSEGDIGQCFPFMIELTAPYPAVPICNGRNYAGLRPCLMRFLGELCRQETVLPWRFGMLAVIGCVLSRSRSLSMAASSRLATFQFLLIRFCFGHCPQCARIPRDRIWSSRQISLNNGALCRRTL